MRHGQVHGGFLVALGRHAMSRGGPLAADLDIAALDAGVVAQLKIETRVLTGEGIDLGGHVHAEAQ